MVAASCVACGASGASAQKPCRGAAAHDPEHPCVNRTLAAFPLSNPRRPSSSRCTDTKEAPQPVCAFGAPEALAKDHFALLGDSHAAQWQDTLDVVGRAKRWRGFLVWHSACYFSAAVDSFLPGPRSDCVGWYRGARSWLRRHSEVSTIFVSGFATTPVRTKPGQTQLAVKSAGYRHTFTTLPRTVKHVFVIRDGPLSSNGQFNCVQAVVAAGKEQPGPACPFPRADALPPDAAAGTARRLHSPRYQVIDMTDYFCDRSTCSLVVGGLLTHKDVDHVGAPYARSLGPFMLRKINRLLAGA
jgi:hypothetical protein